MEDKTFLTIWALTALLALAFWGTVIFVALHFILKVW
jgi:hypothetical protein